jgi:hypothetical protein
MAIERLAPERAHHLLEQLRLGLTQMTDEPARYRAAEALAAAVYPKYKFSEYSRIFLEDAPFLDYYQRFMDPENWHSLDRKYTLNQLMKLTLHLEGDLAECGTYKGVSAYLMCEACRGTDRTIHIFDSFEGLSSPGPRDGDYWTTGALRSSEAVLKETLAPFDNYRVHKGWIPETFREVAALKFNFVHIDVDLYQPTRDSLDFFYDRLVPGGVTLMDDYGFKSCPGAKAAADEFFADRPEEIVLLPTGQSLIVKR